MTQSKDVLPVGDYISPGYVAIRPDSCFPNMVVGDKSTCAWPHLRKHIPHNWYVDRRSPGVGFLSRDEAHILHNTALGFKGKKTLEIGCWMGWSAAHLALAGVELDVVDPLLNQENARKSVEQSLQAAGVLGNVHLYAGYSPQKVRELAASLKTKWSLIFIDGNHEGNAPLEDAIACAEFAEPDAVILFHDLASPDVGRGIDYLREHGWNTVIYSTMQIMGAAWRGSARPVAHYPDPTIAWQIPKHLAGHPAYITTNGAESSKSQQISQLPNYGFSVSTTSMR